MRYFYFLLLVRSLMLREDEDHYSSTITIAWIFQSFLLMSHLYIFLSAHDIPIYLCLYVGSAISHFPYFLAAYTLEGAFELPETFVEKFKSN